MGNAWRWGALPGEEREGGAHGLCSWAVDGVARWV